jgi:hypothetical protein
MDSISAGFIMGMICGFSAFVFWAMLMIFFLYEGGHEEYEDENGLIVRWK